MDIQPLSQPKENNLKHRPMQQQDYAAAFTKKLNQTLLIQSVSASEHAHKLQLKKKKETSKYQLSKEEDLDEEEAFLKRKLQNILQRQQQSLGLF